MTYCAFKLKWSSCVLTSLSRPLFSFATTSYPSQVQTNAFTVIFDERYSIPADLSTLEEYSLRFAAFGIDADERNISAGVADLKLSDLDLTIRPFNAWLYLQDVNKVGYNTCDVSQAVVWYDRMKYRILGTFPVWHARPPTVS